MMVLGDGDHRYLYANLAKLAIVEVAVFINNIAFLKIYLIGAGPAPYVYYRASLLSINVYNKS